MSSLAPGVRLGPYEILAPLAHGGMGEVYSACDVRLGRDVAIKVLPAALATNPDALARFEREAKAIARLSHPNILSIFDFGTQNGVAYAVMELLKGATLRNAGRASPKRAIEYTLQMARGLGAAHDKGIVHRDFKPDNIFVTAEGHLKILDFAFALEEATTTVAISGSGLATQEASLAAVDSLAVMPLVNESASSETDYLSDGLTDSLIDNLSQLPRLRVMARSTVFQYKDRGLGPQQIGKELGVRAVLSGRLMERRESIVVHVELVDVGDGTRLWGKRFNRPLVDLLAVEEEISREICDNLRITLNQSESDRLARRQTENPEAHQVYLKGRYVWSRWKTPAGMKTSIGLFERALELDPLYARAFAGLADSYSVLGNVKALPPDEAYPKAKTAALQGLAIDDTLAELHTSLGFIHRMWDWDWEAAEAAYQRAIALNPGYATAHRWYSHLLSGLARHDDALVVGRRALDLDPLSLIIRGAFGDVLFYARRYDEAIQLYRDTIRQDPEFLPGHTDLARAYELRGRYEEAISEFRIAQALVAKGPPEPSSGLAHVYAQMGRREEALAIVKELVETARSSYVSPYGIGSIYACLGEKNAALDWLEKAEAEHDQTLVWIKVHPRLDGLRGEPRFQRLLARLRL